jgi:hypothetical protein
MNKLKKLYKEFFGITEQATPKGSISVKDPAKAEELAKKGLDVKLVDEAQLINHMTDYRGGIEYVVRDPAEAQSVSQNIQQWAEKKGFTIVNKQISKSGNVGYFYFRLGEDPSRESQKIQGYISQMPSIKHFRFNVRSQKPRPAQPTPDMV